MYPPILTYHITDRQRRQDVIYTGHYQVKQNINILDWTTAYLVQCENADRQDVIRTIQKTRS